MESGERGRGGIVERRAEGLDVRLGSPSSCDAPSVLSCFVHVPISWPPLPPLYSLVLPTYSPDTDVAVGGCRGGRVGHPGINSRLEVGIGDVSQSICHARGDEGQEDGKVRVFHACYDRGGDGGSW